jgi:bifunctional ADP-heptose synthase (sugar kinase/adenylyltransferase)
MITWPRLESFLETFPRLTIGLLGDLFLDRYLELQPGVEEYSIETGLEAYQVERVRNAPGALGTVINNLAALGVGRLVPVTVIGDDGHGYDLLRELSALPVDPTHILRAADRLTPTYTKPLRPAVGGGWRELNRLDVKSRVPLTSPTCAAVCRNLREVFHATDGLIVLDQVAEENLGVVDERVRICLEQLSREGPGKLVYVDSRAQLQRFAFGMLKGNQAELLAASGATTVEAAGRKLAAKTGRVVFCTVGEEGLLVIRPDGSLTAVPAYPVSGPIDIVGAGDSATSGIVASLLAGGTDIEAAAAGNLVASITVQQLGTTGTASPAQVRARWQETRRNPQRTP